MKNYLLKSMLFVAFVAFSGLLLAQTNVTLHVIDTSKTLTKVFAKGSFNGWANVEMTKTTGASANDFAVTVSVTDDGSYEWGAVQDDGSANGIWLPSLAGFGSNPTFNLAAGAVTGDLVINMPVVDPIDVVVAVDMSFEITSKGDFNVETDTVGVSGPFNSWGYTKLTKGATDSIYSATIKGGNVVEFKFRKKDQWEGSPNRVVYVDGNTNPTVLDPVWYGDISPAILVSIKCYVIDGTKLLTGLQYKGEITGWGNVPMYDDGTNGDEVAGDHTWTVTLDNVAVGASYKWGAVDGDDNWLIVGPDRVVVVASDGSTTGETYEIEGYGDVPVTFMVNMNCHINLEVFEIGVTCLDINMDGYPPVELEHVDTGLYAVTIARFDIDDTLAYTYRIGCAFGGDYEEYPGDQNNRTYVVVEGENSTGVELYQDDILTNPCNYEGEISVKNVYADMIQVYPNPVNNEVRVSSEFEIESIELYNITGQKVMSINGINRFAQFLNAESLNQGIYVISVNGVHGETAITKIIKN